MSDLLVKDRTIVVPGEILAEGMDYIPSYGVFREQNRIVAMQLGLVSINGRVIKLIPLSGRYIPKKADVVIGKVADIGFYGWRVDIGWAFQANLGLKDASSEFIEKGADLSQYYDYGDIIAAQITNVSGSKIIDLSMKGPGLKKLKGGKIIEVSPSKVPRIIGKQGSMVNLIKEKTNCKIIVGQNGKIWISGLNPETELLATNSIYKIEQESHLDGLTDRIKEFLDKGVKNGLQ
ncbi:RNA-binding protein [Candidatus Woesearchaeota archaeon]|nr:RNA-binding protein [Candidatus Woesearchaeota archaeon]